MYSSLNAVNYASPTTYAAAPATFAPTSFGAPTYAAPTVYAGATSYASPTAYTGATTYAAPTAYAGATSYASPTAYAGATTYAAPMAYAGATTYAAPTVYAGATTYAAPTTYAGATSYASPTTYQPSSIQPVSYVTESGYCPKTVQEAWDNHFSAFGEQDLDKIMMDYDDLSVARVFNNVEDTEATYFKGVEEIRSMFASLFADLADLSTLEAPVVDVEEDARQVFLVWKCPGSGYHTATDTFIYKSVGGVMRISRQNIVVTKQLMVQ